MRTFKTIHILELLTGKELVEEFPRFKGRTEVLLFLCGAENLQREITAKHLIAINNVNRAVYTESLFSQHTLLRNIMDNVPDLSQGTTKEWYAWAKAKVKILGKELHLDRAERTFIVPPPVVTGSIKFYVN